MRYAPLTERKHKLRSILPKDSDRIMYCDHVEHDGESLFRLACENDLEGVVAKRKDSRYEAGKRSGAWAKYRLNSGQELVIGGYTPSAHNFDSIIVGDCEGRDLRYVARIRNGFIPASRETIFRRFRGPKSRAARLPTYLN